MTDLQSACTRPNEHDLQRAVVRRWREITGGSSVRDAERRTLVACSGGADSCALLVSLARGASPGTVIAAHIVHDMRPHEESRRDADAVQALARSLGVRCVERSIAARATPGNLEAASRRLRYAALAEMAREASAVYVATAHHADDQLETILMRLMRGSGPAGLAGIAARRAIDRNPPSVWVIRPMLAIGRADTESICRAAGITWAQDATNSDLSRVRNALRNRVLPVLAELRPDAAARASESADLCRRTWRAISREADCLQKKAHVSGGTLSWARADLRDAAVIVTTESLRRGILRVSAGVAQDRITRRSLLAAVRAIRSSSGEIRTFQWRAATLVVDAQRVTLHGPEVRELSGSPGEPPGREA